MSTLDDYIDMKENIIPGILPCFTHDGGHTLICNETRYVLPEVPLTYHDIQFWLYISLYIFLMLSSGIFSGLVIGLVSLDLTILNVLKAAGTPSVKKYATKIAPLVERHHLLLVTLLLANAIAMEALPLCLDRVSDPLTAIFVSVTTVLFFGEVIPQAVCARHGLAIGAVLTPLVYFLMGLFFVVAYPISKLLDCILGKGHGTFYRRAELKALVNLHGKKPPHSHEPHHEVLTKDEIRIIQGVLDMKDKTVADAMIPIDEVFMLNVNGCLNDETLMQIQKSSFSRIPIYERTKQNIQGILMVKCLIRLNPLEARPIRRLFNTRALQRPHYTTSDTSLLDVLNHFQTSKSHVSIVTKSLDSCEINETIEECFTNYYSQNVIGIITLEGIIEELLQRPIFKEYEKFQSSLGSVFHMALAKLSSRKASSSNLSGIESTALLSQSFHISFSESFEEESTE